MNRDDYMDGTVDFQTFYCHLADALGRHAIERIVLEIADLPTLQRCYATDVHLNNIPLSTWDVRDDSVRYLVQHRHMEISWSAHATPIKPGMVAWSLAESVCVLKAAARRMVLEANAANTKPTTD